MFDINIPIQIGIALNILSAYANAGIFQGIGIDFLN